MINAIEARKNVNQCQQKVHYEVTKLVLASLEEIGKSIEFHSHSGRIEAEFAPYDKSRYHYNRNYLDCAKNEFERILIQNGYQIEKNSWEKNILKIRW